MWNHDSDSQASSAADSVDMKETPNGSFSIGRFLEESDEERRRNYERNCHVRLLKELRAKQASEAAILTRTQDQENEALWSSAGASMTVATRPMLTCHSMWQWKSQTPGLSAVNLRITWLLPLTLTVSRLIGTDGKALVSPPNNPAPEAGLSHT